jgi:hypothetical protein
MRTLRETLPPEKVIFSFLSWQHLGRASRQLEYETFALLLRRVYGCDAPPKLGGAYFLYFEDGWRPRLAGVPLWQRPFFWLCSRPSAVWNLLMRFNTKADLWVFNPVFRPFDYLPTPRVFRGFSVPAVREALRPVLSRRGLRLPRWRTAVFVAAVALTGAALWWAPSFYEAPPGHYRVVAYDEKERVIFSGDLRVESERFEGTYELTFATGVEAPRGCYRTPISGGESVRGALRGESPARLAGGLKLTFEGLGDAEVRRLGSAYRGWWFSLREEPKPVDVNELGGDEGLRAMPEAIKRFYETKGARDELRLAALCGGKRIELNRLLW